MFRSVLVRTVFLVVALNPSTTIGQTIQVPNPQISVPNVVDADRIHKHLSTIEGQIHLDTQLRKNSPNGFAAPAPSWSPPVTWQQQALIQQWQAQQAYAWQQQQARLALAMQIQYARQHYLKQLAWQRAYQLQQYQYLMLLKHKQMGRGW